MSSEGGGGGEGGSSSSSNPPPAAAAPDTASDEMVSQFLAFTGSADPSRASSYLEMSGGDLETAVALFMDHQAGGGGGGGLASGPPDLGGSSASASAAGAASSSYGPDGDVRAPDQTQTMRLMDFEHGGAGGVGGLPSASHAAMFGPSAAGLMSAMLGGAAGGPDAVDDVMMGSSWGGVNVGGSSAAFDAREAVNRDAARRMRRSTGGGSGGGDSDDDDGDDDDEDYAGGGGGGGGGSGEDDDEEVDSDGVDGRRSRSASTGGGGGGGVQSLSDMFAAPTHLMHRAGGFQGARAVAKDARRWLLVNLQRESDFACHALNRDVWRDELVENLVREGFIFWQTMDVSNDGQTYCQRYNVHSFPHLAIIDPRTGRLMWRKEGWTQVDPLTPEMFAEIAADFCSRHSFDKPPVAPRSSANGAAVGRPAKRPLQEMTEEQQLQAAIRASMKGDGSGSDGEEMDHDEDEDEDDLVMEDDSDVENGVTSPDDEQEEGGKKAAAEEEEEKPPTFEEELVAMTVGEEPTGGDIARVQIRMPDGKRLVRKFSGGDPVKIIYAFVAQSNDEAKGGKTFELKAGFPPKDLLQDIDNTIVSCGLAGDTITVRWK